MTPELLEILRLISRILLLAGAIATTWFFVDYIRSANTKLAYSRMVLLLNLSLGVVLWTQLLLNFFGGALWSYIFLLAMFAVVDVMLFYQIRLLHKARRDATERKRGAASSDTSRREEDV